MNSGTMKARSIHLFLFFVNFCLCTFSNAQVIGDWPNDFITWDIKDCPQFPQYDYWERNCLIKTAEPSGEILIPQGGVDGLNLEQPMWISIPTNRPTWAIAIAHAWNLHRNFIQKVNYPKIGYYMAITGHETGMACDCQADFTPGHRPWSTTGQGELNWPAKCGHGARSDDGCFQMEFLNAWGELNQIFPHRFPCSNYDDVISGDVFETQALALSYRNIGYSLLMEYSWNMNPWEIFENPNCDEYAYEKFLAASWNGSISGTYKTLTQSNVFSLGGWEPDPTKQKANPVHMFENRVATANNPNWDLDGTVAYYPEVIAWSIAAIEGNTTYPGYRYNAGDYTGALISTGTGQAGEFDYLGVQIPAGGKIPLNSVNGTHPELQNHVQFGHYDTDIYWTDIDYYIDRMIPFYYEFGDPVSLTAIKDQVKKVFIELTGDELTPISFKKMGPIIDEIILSFPKENPLIAMLQLDGLPNGPSGSGNSTCTGLYAPASHIKPVNITTDTMCTKQTLILEADVVGGEEPNMDYTWYLDGNSVASGVDVKEYAFTPLTPGQHYFELMICNQAGGCSMASCTYYITVNECSACNLTASVSTVNTPCRNTAGGALILDVLGSVDYTVYYDGPLKGQVKGTTAQLQIDELLDGIYNIRVEDNIDPTCFYLSSEEIEYDFYMNDVVQASVGQQRDCETDIDAEIVKDDCKCDYTVFARALVPNRWERFITMKISPSNGRFEIFRANTFVNSGAPLSRKFQLCSGETLKGELHIIPASGSCDINRPDAVNNQLESYEVWVIDPEGTEIHRQTYGPGTATQFNDYLMFDITIQCPYVSPFDYSYQWNPSGKTTASITEQNGANQSIMYTVVATNIQHPQCVTRDSVLVPFSCSTGCTSPGTVKLSPEGALSLCGANQELIATTSVTTPPGGFEYEFFHDGGNGANSVQGPSNFTTFQASSRGDYYVVVTDPSNPATCIEQSNTVSILIDTPPSPAVVFDNDTIVCTTNLLISANLPGVGQGSWTVVNGTGVLQDSLSESTVVSGLSNGINRVVWTIENGVCPNKSDEIVITVDEPVSIALAGHDSTICGDSSSLFGTIPLIGTGRWQLVSGAGLIHDNQSSNTIVTNLGVGDNVFEWTISGGGACPSTSDQVTITSFEKLEHANAGISQVICADTHTLNAQIPLAGHGEWKRIEGAGLLVDSSNASSSIIALGVGNNVFEWVVSNGVCPIEKDQVAITVEQMPSPAIARMDSTICNTDIQLEAIEPVEGTGYWRLISGAGNIVDSSQAATLVSNLAVGDNVFEWNVSNGAVCPISQDQVIISRDESPTIARAGIDSTICLDEHHLSAAVPSVGIGGWSVLTGSGNFIDSTNASTVVSGLSLGDNILEWIVSNGVCPIVKDQIILSVNEVGSIARAGADTTICLGEFGLSAQSPVIGIGHWSLVSGTGIIANDSLASTVVSNLGVGDNVFEWVVANGSVCPSSMDQLVVTRDEMPSLAIAGDDQTICSSSTNLNAMNPIIGDGIWSVVSGVGIIDHPSNGQSTLSNILDGVVVLRWTTNNGSCPISFDEMQISKSSEATAKVLVSPTINSPVCEGGQVSFKVVPVNGGLKPLFQWYLNGQLNGVQDTVSKFTIASVQQGDSIQVSMESNLGCALGSPALSDKIGVIVDKQPSIAIVDTSRTICDSEVDVQGNIPLVGVGRWELISGGGSIANPASAITRVSRLDEGSNILAWTIKNGGCPSNSSQVIITRLLNNLDPEAGNDTVICETVGSHNLQASAVALPITGRWSTNSGAFIDDVMLPTTTVSNLSIGDNVFYWTLNNGVCEAKLDSILITLEEAPSISNAGIDQVICDSISTLTASIPQKGQGTWATQASKTTVVDVNDPNSRVKVALGDTRLEWVVSTGNTCAINADDVLIRADGSVPVFVELISDGFPVCENEVITFKTQVTNGGKTPQYEWYINGDKIDNNGASFTSLGLRDNDNIAVTIKSSLTCVSSDSSSDFVQVEVNPPVIPQLLNSDIEMCEDEKVYLKALSSLPFYWLKDGIVQQQGGEIELNSFSGGDWSLETIDSVCGSQSSKAISVQVFEKPIISISKDIVVVSGESVQLISHVSTGDIEWFPQQFIDNPLSISPIFNTSEKGSYLYTMNATNGPCITSDDMVVQVEEPLRIPNAFSPNGDEVNDRWLINGLMNFDYVQVSIFNRWGNKIYEKFGTYDFQNAWDGDGYPVGTYYYIIRLGENSPEDSEERVLQGAVTLTK